MGPACLEVVASPGPPRPAQKREAILRDAMTKASTTMLVRQKLLGLKSLHRWRG